MLSSNDLNAMISIFVDRNVCELNDSDLISASQRNGKKFTLTDIRRLVQTIGTSLFQLQDNDDWSFTVKVEPAVSSSISLLLLVIHY